jgi:hypothetical protein
LSKIEERVVSVQLGPKRARFVGEDLIFDFGAIFRARDAPGRFVDLLYGKSGSRRTTRVTY